MRLVDVIGVLIDELELELIGLLRNADEEHLAHSCELLLQDEHYCLEPAVYFVENLKLSVPSSVIDKLERLVELGYEDYWTDTQEMLDDLRPLCQELQPA